MSNPFDKIKVPEKAKVSVPIVPYASGGSTPSIRAQNVTYTVTNDTTDRVFDADTAVLTEVSDVLATLIRDLQASGIIK